MSNKVIPPIGYGNTVDEVKNSIKLVIDSRSTDLMYCIQDVSVERLFPPQRSTHLNFAPDMMGITHLKEPVSQIDRQAHIDAMVTGRDTAIIYQQQIFLSWTLVKGILTPDLLIALEQDPATRDAWLNSQGDVFWLIRLILVLLFGKKNDMAIKARRAFDDLEQQHAETLGKFLTKFDKQVSDMKTIEGAARMGGRTNVAVVPPNLAELLVDKISPIYYLTKAKMTKYFRKYPRTDEETAAEYFTRVRKRVLDYSATQDEAVAVTATAVANAAQVLVDLEEEEMDANAAHVVGPKTKRPRRAPPAQAENKPRREFTQEKGPCWNFSKGKCTFGERCKYQHDEQVPSLFPHQHGAAAASQPSAPPPPSQVPPAAAAPTAMATQQLPTWWFTKPCAFCVSNKLPGSETHCFVDCTKKRD